VPRSLPPATTLPPAVNRVIVSNIGDGWRPSRFIQVTQSGAAENLGAVGENLILSGEAQGYVIDAFRRDQLPYLTIEDYESQRGADWGFSDGAIEQAKAAVDTFDKLIGGGPRYS
jgi:hypothetical protein